MTEQTIRDFIAKRLAADEAAALATTEHQPIDEWDAVGAGDHDDIAKCNWQVVGIASPGSHTPSNRAIMQHIARHDPARVLRQTAAGRDILDRHFNTGDGSFAMACIGCPDSTMDGGPTVDHVDECPELQALAFYWVDDPDWDLNWCPHVEGRRRLEVTDHRDPGPRYTNACVRCGSGDGWHHGRVGEEA